MDAQVNKRGFWKKVNRGGLLLLILLVAAVVFFVAMAAEESRMDKIAAKVIDEYNETLAEKGIDSAKAAKDRKYYDYNVSYTDLDRVTVTALYMDKYDIRTDYYELERSGGSWQVVFSNCNPDIGG